MKPKLIYLQVKTFLFNEFVRPIQNQFFIFTDKRALKKAIKYAKYLSKANNGRRYVVMKDYNDRYRVFNRDQFFLMRRRGVFTKRTTWFDVVRSAAYVAFDNED